MSIPVCLIRLPIVVKTSTATYTKVMIRKIYLFLFTITDSINNLFLVNLRKSEVCIIIINYWFKIFRIESNFFFIRDAKKKFNWIIFFNKSIKIPWHFTEWPSFAHSSLRNLLNFCIRSVGKPNQWFTYHIARQLWSAHLYLAHRDKLNAYRKYFYCRSSSSALR